MAHIVSGSGSPTSTASSLASSFDMLSLVSFPPPRGSDDETCSNDEIVWDITETSSSSSSSDLTESCISLGSDDDFIVLSRPRSPSPIAPSSVLHSPPEDYEITYRSVVEELSTIDFNIPPPAITKPPSARRKSRPKDEANNTEVKSLAMAPPPSPAVVAPQPQKPKKKAKSPTSVRTECVWLSTVKFNIRPPVSTTPTPRKPQTKKNSGVPKAKGPDSVTPANASNPKKVKKKKKKKKAAPSLTTASQTAPPGEVQKKKKAKTASNVSIIEATKKSASKDGLGTRPIVDDVSESGLECDEAQGWRYDEAKKYVSSFLSNPAESAACRLTFMQSLIIELGLCGMQQRSSPVQPAVALVPRTLTSAKAFFKSHVFLNIRDYLAVREQGQDALQSVLHPSKSALIRDIKRKGKPASLKWVKQHGLQVLLVTCHY